ncbi:hypothetical protein AB0M91_19550 [Micromonospora rifamycinica]|uniref:hypothetical protein n=1 Tax=Micromonospora rifamycinica TaxID=291594 RepID=UPI003447FDCF
MDWAEFIAQYIPAPRTIRVEAFEAGGAYGDVYADPVDVAPCVVDDTTRRVVAQTQDAEGGEVVSSTTVFAPPTTIVTPGSRVRLDSGRVTRVLAVSHLDAHGHPLPEHVELSLE